MEYLSVGKIVNTIGLKGEVKIYVTSSFPTLRFSKDSILYYQKNDEFIPITVNSSYKKDSNFYVVKFKEINSESEGFLFKNTEIFALKDKSILNKNEYFYNDLISLNVITEDGKNLGVINKVEEFPAQITLKVLYNKKYYFIPFNDFFIKKVDLENHQIIIHYIEGLLS
ncbi:MAG TPA: 16S rRNA processing protein RimM [Firmicutes bacterium]|nr:16S rRNA processing protein RimM [Bacillota bacterium]